MEILAIPDLQDFCHEKAEIGKRNKGSCIEIQEAWDRWSLPKDLRIKLDRGWDSIKI